MIAPSEIQSPRSSFEGPTVLTMLATYRCTAACRECCFECNPSLTQRVPIDRILLYIDEAAQDFPSMKLVVFSGGSVFC
jgi:MoaA/NifB/PqqE/SkfB family radical SAM enzyme